MVRDASTPTTIGPDSLAFSEQQLLKAGWSAERARSGAPVIGTLADLLAELALKRAQRQAGQSAQEHDEDV